MNYKVLLINFLIIAQCIKRVFKFPSEYFTLLKTNINRVKSLCTYDDRMSTTFCPIVLYKMRMCKYYFHRNN